ncbi:uncharacterized protein LOC107615073 [Arachis ipaensis]|uniref:uncharacterized protein LOC107615073 n=1 Tax=Arachis ipaensis TaxID=130454 RepID=UPI0007AF0980|nr:uncharacterized protein LOC107615073 [Arachis ipaensis]
MDIRRASMHDYSLFTRTTDNDFTTILVYVDDLVLAGNNSGEIERIKGLLDDAFKIKDLEKLKYFIGMKVARNNFGIALHQQKYMLDLLSKFDMINAKLVSTPMDYSTKLSKDCIALFSDVSLYRIQVGHLLYFINTRPDISFIVGKLSQCLDCPTITHHQAALRVLKYLKLALAQSLFFPTSSNLVSTVYSDSNWAGCPDTQKSVTGTYFFLGTALVSWKSKK